MVGTMSTANKFEKIVENIALAVLPPESEVNAMAEATVVGKIESSQNPKHYSGVSHHDIGTSNSPITTGNHR